MHRKYAAQGVVCLSVSLDEAGDREKTLTFLKKQEATFPNYLLDEETKVWQEHWNVKAPPVVFVFDREGKRAGKFDTENDRTYTYEDVESLVKQLLKP